MDKRKEKIVLKNANQKPFGLLRNDYESDLYIDNKRWKSVSNYVYANLLPSTDFRKKTIEFVNPKNAEQEFRVVYDAINKNTLSSAVKTGIEAKLSLDPQFKQSLLDTEGKTILYLSKNDYLGYTGEGQNSTNMYGVWLEHFRTVMIWTNSQVGKHPVLKDDEIYDSYLAEKGLRLALQFENLDKYIEIDKQDESRGLVNVIKALIRKYGREKIFVVDKETALALQRRRNIEPIIQASNLIRYIRKIAIRDVKNKNIEQMKQKIFEAFVDDLMDSQFDEEEFERGDAGFDEKRAIMKNQFNTISFSELTSLIQRTIKLFEAGELNKKVLTKGNEIVKGTFIPSFKEIDQYENDTVPIPVAPKIPTVGTVDTRNLFKTGIAWIYPYLNDPISNIGKKSLEHRFEYDLLSPANDTVMLQIEGYKYPSISHYLIVRVAQTLPGYEGIDKAYSIIYSEESKHFFSVNDSEKRINHINTQIYYSEKISLLFKALRSKFEQRLFKDVLLGTSTKTIVYETQGYDKEIIDKNTADFLEEIRISVLPESMIYTNTESIVSSFELDEFMEMFMVEKTKDISLTIKFVQIYCKHKDLDFKLTERFIEKVLQSFYGECVPKKHITIKRKKGEAVTWPFRFEEILSGQFKIRSKKSTSVSMTPAGAFLIFNTILETLLNMRDVLQTGNAPIIGKDIPMYATLFKMALIDSQWLLVNKKNKNLKFDTGGKRNNDVISAIINVISLLHSLHSDSDYFVDEVDIKTAISILTGKLEPITEIETPRGTTREQIIAEEILQEDILQEDIQERVQEAILEDILEEEEEEEREGVDYEDELPEFDEEAYYEGQVRTIKGHLENLGLSFDSNIDKDIKNAAEKIKNKLKINFYS